MRNILAAIIAALILAFATVAKADTYSYTGQNFANESGSISGTLTFASPLGDNLFEAIVKPTSWDFTAGSSELTNHSLLATEFFEVWTDAKGNIVAWALQLDGFDSGTPTEIVSESPGGDFAESGSGGGLKTDFTTVDGSWSNGSAPPAVPEPSSLVLLGTGILGFAGMMKRKFVE